MASATRDTRPWKSGGGESQDPAPPLIAGRDRTKSREGDPMEQFTRYYVQFWVEGYEYWQSIAEPAQSMFGLPTVGRDTQEEGEAQLAEMRAKYPQGKYRLIRETTVREEI